MENITVVEKKDLMIIQKPIRILFFCIILSISILATVANLMIFKTVFSRKIKTLQKTSIINLGLADIITVMTFAINNLETLSKELKNWTLGNLMCDIIPTGQTFGVTLSSLSILTIAVDRYRTINGAANSKWNPKLRSCLWFNFMLWLMSAGFSCPMIWIYSSYPVYIVAIEHGELTLFEKAYLCIAIQKETLLIYYVTLSCLVFLPLLIFFMWSYIRIATVIWQHDTPITQVANSQLVKRKTFTDHRFERKVRTFKVVIFLLLSFVLCRCPYWIFFIIRIASNHSSSAMWTTHFTLIALGILNCALNPLLYNFLNESITVCELLSHIIRKFMSCFCCFINEEFEELSKYDPFGNKDQKRDDALKGNNVDTSKKGLHTLSLQVSRN